MSPAARVPAYVMAHLRYTLPQSSHEISVVRTQHSAARLLGVNPRTVQRWESSGAHPLEGWAYVGVAFRVGGPEHAQKMLEILSQASFNGADAWGQS